MERELRPRVKAIVGLGNPGRDLERTRHNLGFEVVDFLKGKSEFTAGSGKFFRCDTEISSPSLPDRGAALNVVLLKPTTYMNRSGIAVERIVEEMGLEPREILVIADDFNLPLGRLRLRQSGSDGGHNGLASIVYHLGTEDFPRIRMGIGPIPEKVPAEEFVLERFTVSETEIVEGMIARAAGAVTTWMSEGFEQAASVYNQAPLEN